MKKIRVNTFILSMVIIIFGFNACYYDNEEELYPGTGGGCDTVPVSFSQQVQPLINLKCAIAGCHLNSQSPILTSYSVISSNADRIRQRVYLSRDMPPAGSGVSISDEERRLISNWVCQGAQNN